MGRRMGSMGIRGNGMGIDEEAEGREVRRKGGL